MDKLAPYVLQNVQGLKPKTVENLDSGAYGVVFEVTLNGLPCMAKRLHAILVKDVSKEDKNNIEKRFRSECLLLSRLKHPNIVRFIGVCYLESNIDLALVMEKLHSDVAAFVRVHAHIPIPIKTSVMLDVSYGLLYLHTQTPPIIHRDLTAPNVLLTSDLRAKIADLGVSKVLSNPHLVTKTVAPGNINYMSPETKVESPTYGTAVDVFSFGHLLVHISIQDWPPVYELNDHIAMQQGLMEIAKRKKALETMGEKHPLHPLAVECLHDNPARRPPAEELNKRLADLCIHEYPKTFADILDVTAEEDKSQLTGVQVSDDQLKASEEMRRALADQLEALRGEMVAMVTHREGMVEQHSRLEHKFKLAGDQVTTLTTENATLVKECEGQKVTNLQLRNDMQTDRVRLETTIADTARLHDDVLANKQEVKSEKAKFKRLQTKLTEKEGQLTASGDTLRELKETLQTREEANGEEIAHLVNENRLLEEEKMGLAQNLEKVMVSSRAKIEQTLTELQTQVTALRARHTAGEREDQPPENRGAINLPGVEVIGQTTLIITRSAQCFKWDGHGLEINVPPNTLPPEIDHCVLQIYVSLSGQYKLPDNNELVSAIYWIRPIPYCKFTQPVTLQLQHCAQKSHRKNLSFIRAVCTQEKLPYTFTKLDGRGVFSEESRFGLIKLEHFSGFAITAEGGAEMLYTAGLYYIGLGLRSWEIHLVVNRDTEVYNTCIGRSYTRRRAVVGPYMPIEFEADTVTLDIPFEGRPVGNWTIRSLVPPQLTRKRVDYFQPGSPTIPHCRFKARITMETPNIPELCYQLVIDGAKKPNIMVIDIEPQAVERRPRYALRGAPLPAEAEAPSLDHLMEHTGVTDQHLEQTATKEALSLIAPHLHNWLSYANALRLSPQQIQDIDTDKNKDIAMKAVSVLDLWRRRTGFRATYRSLVCACLRLSDAQLAEHVCRTVLEQ